MCEGCVIGSDGSQQRHGTDIDSSAHFLDTIYEARAFFKQKIKIKKVIGCSTSVPQGAGSQVSNTPNVAFDGHRMH